MAEKQTSLITKLVGAFMVAVLAVAIINGASEPDRQAKAAQVETERRAALTPEARKAEDDARAQAERFSSARGACYVNVKKFLHDPDSADFSNTKTWYVEEAKDGTILVQPKLKAKNAFGAVRTGVWDCKVRIRGDRVIVSQLAQIQ